MNPEHKIVCCNPSLCGEGHGKKRHCAKKNTRTADADCCWTVLAMKANAQDHF